MTEEKKDLKTEEKTPEKKDAGASNTPTYITPDDAKKMFEEQMKGFGTFTQEEKSGLITFMDSMGKILTVIEDDPKLKEKIQKGVKGEVINDSGQDNSGVSTEQQDEDQGKGNGSSVSDSKVTELTGQVGSVVRSRRAEIIQGFEKQYGIANLPKEQQDEVRKKIGAKLLNWGHKLEAIPVDALSGLMSDAYIAAQPEKTKDAGFVDGFLAARSGEYGAMPSMSSSTPNAEAESGKLTKAQEGYAQKLGVDPVKAAETVKATT